MRHETQVRLAERILEHLENETTDLFDDVTINPAKAYTCPQRFEAEQDIIRREPVLMGLSCTLPHPRSYLTDDNTGIPILMLRDNDGRFRAFLNACKHRGSRLLDGAGRARQRIVCPYHAWTYDLEGQLVHVPQQDAFPGLDIAACGLTELPALEEHGLLWVRPQGAEPIHGPTHLAGLEADFSNFGFDRYHHYETRRIDCKMNWKVIIDTFLEPYHFTPLHNDTVAPIFFPSLCLFDPYGRNIRETFPRRTIVDLRDQSPSNWDLIKHTAVVYVLFPNSVFVMQADHAEVWRVFPSGGRPDRSHVFLEFYIPEPAETEKARGHWDRNMSLVMRTVEREDFPTGEGAQKAFASGALESVIYGRNEPALAFFEKTMAAAVGEDI